MCIYTAKCWPLLDFPDRNFRYLHKLNFAKIFLVTNKIFNIFGKNCLAVIKIIVTLRQTHAQKKSYLMNKLQNQQNLHD